MATIRAYTTIEQSRKLAEILPLESADMIYPSDFDFPFAWIEKPKKDKNATPCWSLAALLSVLPLPSLIQDKADDELFWQCSAYSEDGTLLCEICDNNPVDACYDMIIRLNENLKCKVEPLT